MAQLPWGANCCLSLLAITMECADVEHKGAGTCGRWVLEFWHTFDQVPRQVLPADAAQARDARQHERHAQRLEAGSKAAARNCMPVSFQLLM